MFDVLFPSILKLIRSWHPQEYSKELEYRDDLLNYLRENLNRPDPFGTKPSHIVRKETGDSRADISVDGKIGIELKYNLNKKRKVDTLFGQLDSHLRQYSKVVIVLCGVTDNEQLEYLKEKVQGVPREMFSKTQIEIIVKDPKEKLTEQDKFTSFNEKIKRLI